MASNAISLGGVVLRVIAAAVLVFCTYNPEGMSFYHWAIAPVVHGNASFTPVKFLAGIVLLAGWVVFLQATRRSIGALGALLVAAITGGVIWLLIDQRVVTASSGRGIANIVLIALSLILGVGMSWSHFSRRLSGQSDTDVVN
jgi:hypothetical protein